MTRYVRYELAGCKVTGAASGIGLGTATLLARSGAAVAINFLPEDSRGPEAIETLRREGLKVIAAPAQVGKPGETEAMVEKAVADLGGLDLLFNNKCVSTPLRRAVSTAPGSTGLPNSASARSKRRF